MWGFEPIYDAAVSVSRGVADGNKVSLYTAEFKTSAHVDRRPTIHIAPVHL